MRTQHAHYGCGTVFGVVVYSGVPTLEMLVVKEWQGGRERQTERRKQRKLGDEEGLADKSEEDKGFRLLQMVTEAKHRQTEIERGRERHQNGTESERNHSGQELVWPLSTTSCISKPSLYTGRRQNQEHKQVDTTTCKGKTQTTETLHIYTHAREHLHTHTHTFLVWTVFLCAVELRETALSGSPPPPP